MAHLIQKIEARLNGPLPGRDAHLRMAHITRRHYMDAPDSARQAAVLMMLFPKDGEWHIVLIERHTNDRDLHSGQLSFPGGKAEPSDLSMSDTALRETEEEVGIPRNQVKLLGGLTQLYIPVSNFLVHPFLGYLDEAPSFTLQAAEVSQVLEVPLSYFRVADIRRTTDIRVGPQITLKKVPYFDLYGKNLWGATAMMMNELLEMIEGP